jgi:HSP20 family protein
MALLQPWRPFRELERVRDEFDRLMDRFGEDWLGGFELAHIHPHVESFIEEGKLTIRAELPGVEPKDIEIGVTGQMLTIKAKREEKFEEKKRHFIRRELRYGSFERSMELPPGVKAENVKASYHDGVLELTAPVPKELEQKEIKVQVEREEPKKIEAKEHKAA